MPLCVDTTCTRYVGLAVKYPDDLPINTIGVSVHARELTGFSLTSWMCKK